MTLSRRLGKRDHQRRWTRDGFPYMFARLEASNLSGEHPHSAMSEPQAEPRRQAFETNFAQQAISPNVDLRLESFVVAGSTLNVDAGSGRYATTRHRVYDLLGLGIVTRYKGGEAIGPPYVKAGRRMGWHRAGLGSSGTVDSLFFPTPGPYRGALLPAGSNFRFNLQTGGSEVLNAQAGGYFR